MPTNVKSMGQRIFAQGGEKGLLRCTMTNSDLLNWMKAEKCYDLRRLT